MLKMWNK